MPGIASSSIFRQVIFTQVWATLNMWCVATPEQVIQLQIYLFSRLYFHSFTNSWSSMLSVTQIQYSRTWNLECGFFACCIVSFHENQPDLELLTGKYVGVIVLFKVNEIWIWIWKTKKFWVGTVLALLFFFEDLKSFPSITCNFSQLFAVFF